EYTEIRKSSKKIHALDKDVKTVNYIKHSARETSDTKIRNKGVDIYYSLKRDGYESSGHAVTRMAERMFKKNGQYNYNYQTIINTLHKKPNFIDSRNGRLVRYYNKIAIITEKDTNYIVTFIKQRKKGNGWTQL
ncbi:hypothetical protein GA0061074_1261, partial [Weissella bombi]